MTITLPNTAPRDVEALLKQYSNLINSIYQQESSRFTYNTDSGRVGDKIKQDDLRSYIIYQFITLVKEYDPHSGVDFPYYIKEKLTLRTRHSYIKKVFRDEYREVSDDASSNSVLANVSTKELSEEFNRNYGDISLLDGVSYTPLQEAILDLWLEGTMTNGAVVKTLQQEDSSLTSKEINQDINLLKEHLRERAYEFRLVKREETSNKNALTERSEQQ